MENILLFIKENQILSGTGTLFVTALLGWKTLFQNKKTVLSPVEVSNKINKSDYKIVFIDDQTFKIVDILKKNGWVNTRRVKDVASLEDSEIKESNVLFVDINGVGKILNFNEEGLGLAKALKEKYPYKRVIIYSADQHGNRFHPVLSLVDKCLSKNADYYEFERLIQDYLDKDNA